MKVALKGKAESLTQYTGDADEVTVGIYVHGAAEATSITLRLPVAEGRAIRLGDAIKIAVETAREREP